MIITIPNNFHRSEGTSSFTHSMFLKIIYEMAFEKGRNFHIDFH